MDPLEGARIVGAYTTEQGRALPHRTSFSLAIEALNGALADAGMTLDGIDGFCSNVSGWPPNDSYWAYQLNKQWKWSGGGIAPNGVMEACRQITEGNLNAVAIVFASVRPTGTAVAPWLQSHSEWTGWAGSLPDQPVQFGLVAQRYIHEVGERARQAMAEAAATTRSFGAINPDAVYFGRGPFTAEDVLASRYVAKPLTLLMCSAVTDGGCAIILARRERGRQRPAGRAGGMRRIAFNLPRLPGVADARWLLRARAALP